MNSRLPILMIVTLALLIVPEVVESGEFLQSQSRQSPRVESPAANSSLRKRLTEEVTNKKFVLVLSLSDQQINRLRINGYLSTPIPPKFVNRVGAIRFKKPHSFQSKPLKVSGAKTSRRNRTATVEIDNSVLERLAYQPVDLQIFETGYNRVQLKFNPLGTLAGKLPEEFEPTADEPNQSPYVYVRINSQRGIYGRIKDFETLTIETQFGKVSIPSEEIAGIRFNDGKADRAFIVLKKGDVFSGQIDLDSITVKSRWGDQELKLSEVESLTLNREIVFLRDAINPKRWRLQSTRPVSATIINSDLNQNSGRSILVNPFPTNQPPVAYPQGQVPFGFPN